MNSSNNKNGSQNNSTPTSLDHFFAQTPEVNLNNCDKEQVHLLGSIQSEGALCVVSQKRSNIVATTNNASFLLCGQDENLLGKSLAVVNQELHDALDELNASQTGVHSILDMQCESNGSSYDVIVHSNKAQWIVEFLPSKELDAKTVRKHMRIISRESGKILRAENLETALQIACDATRAITDFDRVKIYQFLPDWSGKVVAESKAEDMPSYLGLHFPDTDIPKQARALFTMVPYRGVFSTGDKTLDISQDKSALSAPLDMSFSLLRSCSVMHTAYLRNMGVSATFSAGILQADKLWGLIACHSNNEMVLPFDVWTSLRELSTALANRVTHEAKISASKKVMDLRKIEADLAINVREKGNLLEVVEEFGPSLMRFMNADGFAFQLGEEVLLSGHTPPQEFVPKLVNWVQTKTIDTVQFHSSALHKEWPEAKTYKDSACGVLFQKVALYRQCYMMWFRRPLSETVTWAGKPTDKFETASADPNAKILPRLSFEAWIGKNNDFCKKWSDAELIVARELLREVLDILASMLIVTEENTRLKAFAASAAAHDIKAPLRQIELALELMADEKMDQKAAKQSFAIATKSAKILKNVSDGILKFMSVPDSKQALTPVVLNDVFGDIQTVMESQIKSSNALLSINTKHSVKGERSLLTSLFLNLINNSIKYSSPAKNPVITVKSEHADAKWVHIVVEDNGIGIRKEFAEQIFSPTERLNQKDGVEGSGLGLSICRRIVNMHEGTIKLDTSYTDGARFVVRFPRSTP